MLHILLISFALFAGIPALAQSWPTKPVKIIVPFPPGGSADPIARVISAKLATSLGHPSVEELRSVA